MQKEDNDKNSILNKLSLLKLIRDRIEFLQEKESTDNYIMQKLHEGENYEVLSESVGVSKGYVLAVCKRYDYQMYCAILTDIHRKKLLKKHNKINYNYK